MELYYVITVVDRDKAEKMIHIHEELKLSLLLTNLGYGTATSEHLLLYDLQQTQKAVISTIASGPSLKALVKKAKFQLFIDIPGNGILAAVPIKSISGGKNLAYLTDGQQLGGKTPSMEFENELIITVLNEGHSDAVMDAAREAGATGGTVLHAKGTGRARAEKFFGVTLAEEKDMIYIIAPSAKKSAIMQSINRTCGIGTPAGAISFSLPVSEAVGFRRLDVD